MAYSYIESHRLSLRAAGYDEAWLQRTILANPLILGLGDLKSAGREVRQSSGGRMDFLFFKPESDTMYEVEVMLGATDESHIIRTLEYWDLESRRWPSHEHRAVIVAEEITNRFFNVIWLLNRSIPIIAIKIDTIVVDGKVTLNFTRVLDIYEAPEGRDPLDKEPYTRQDWEQYANPESMSVFDTCIQWLSQDGRAPRITYNEGHIAAGGTKKNFAWFIPRKRDKHCMVDIRVGEANTDSIAQKLQSGGLDAYVNETGVVRIRLLVSDLVRNRTLVEDTLRLGVAEGGGL